MNNVPKIDLSKYSKEERVDSQVELIIVNGLIAFDCNVGKTAKHFNISKELVNKLFMKYYQHISKISAIAHRVDKTEDTLDMVINMYHNHIKEIKENVDNNPATKILSERLVGSLNKICDRILTSKEQNTKEFDNTVSRLNDLIIKMKQLQVVENGKIEDIQAYLENQESVTEKLLKFKVSDYKYNEALTKHVQVLDTKTGKCDIYPSLGSLQRALGLATSSYLSECCNKEGHLYKDQYRLTFTDLEPTIFE